MPEQASAEVGRHRTGRVVHALAVVLLGIVVPIIVLAQAYTGLATLGDTVGRPAYQTAPAETLKGVQPLLRGANDYALFSVMSAEHTNQVVVTNKQVMKIAIMQIGFAVISLGLMLVILGINDGGGEGAAALVDLKFDFKTGSTGVVVFVVGAAMATAGGVLKNEYTTVPLPGYVQANADDGSEVLAMYRACKDQAGAGYAACFANSFEHFVQGAKP
jgi:hypothetical protein